MQHGSYGFVNHSPIEYSYENYRIIKEEGPCYWFVLPGCPIETPSPAQGDLLRRLESVEEKSGQTGKKKKPIANIRYTDTNITPSIQLHSPSDVRRLTTATVSVIAIISKYVKWRFMGCPTT